MYLHVQSRSLMYSRYFRFHSEQQPLNSIFKTKLLKAKASCLCTASAAAGDCTEGHLVLWGLGSLLTAAHCLQISMSPLPISCPFSLPTPSNLLFAHVVLCNEEQSISLQIKKCEENSLRFRSVKGAFENRVVAARGNLGEVTVGYSALCHKSF